MSRPKVAVVPITAIRENPVALRSVNVESEEFIGLRDSIARQGIIDSISVRRQVETVEGTEVEYYEIVNGLHRYTAACHIGLTELPVTIFEGDKADVLDAQLVANIHRIETKPIEYTKQLLRILSLKPTMTQSDLAVRLAKSLSWIHQRLDLLKLEKSIQQLVDSDQITLANAVALAKLPPDEQLNYVDQAITMNTDEFAPTVQARAKEIKDAKREGRSAGPAVFVPIAKQRSLGDLKTEYLKHVIGPELCRAAGVTTAEEGFALGVAFAINLDPISVAEQVAKDAEKKQNLVDAKKKREAERAKKKAEEAATLAARLQDEVN